MQLFDVHRGWLAPDDDLRQADGRLVVVLACTARWIRTSPINYSLTCCVKLSERQGLDKEATLASTQITGRGEG